MNDYLIHHGILGQKWGIRRFQNKDGSLTAEGRKRYSETESSSMNAKEKAKMHTKMLNSMERLRADYLTSAHAARDIENRASLKTDKLLERKAKSKSEKRQKLLQEKYERIKQRMEDARDNASEYEKMAQRAYKDIDSLMKKLYDAGYAVYGANKIHDTTYTARQMYLDGEGFVKYISKVGLFGPWAYKTKTYGTEYKVLSKFDKNYSVELVHLVQNLGKGKNKNG